MITKEYIYIEGLTKEEVVEIVQDMSNLYADVEYSKGIKIFESNKNSFIINFSFKPDFERFKYFVNYLHYPEVENHKAQVRGYWTIDNGDGLPENHSSQRVMLYVSDSDEEGDNVSATFDQELSSYKFGFAVGKEYEPLKKMELKFDEPIVNATEYKLIKTIQPDLTTLKKSSSKGCFLTLFLLIPISIWLVFG